MCGILGTTFKTDNMEKALMTIKHRGPDGSRIEEFPQGKLGFVRLSIRDLSETAMQPMSNNDRNVWLLFNGEIYREKALRDKLIEKGYKFRTTSDTEVILNAYLEYGEKFIEYIDGMFAIAVIDLRKMKIFLYRDRVGIKPLMYYYDGNGISFASEIKAILELHKGKKFERDNSAIYDYFTYRYIPEPKTLYRNIYKVEPATRIEYDINTKVIQKSKYWKLKVNTHFEQQHNEEETCERLRRLISESVESQLVSDVPVGTFLSGGIDSSVVSAEIFRKNKKVHAFSMGFEVQNPREKNYDETSYAQQLADLYHFPITYGQFDKRQLRKLKNLVSEWFDEPFADTSCYPTYAISNIAKKNEVAVILTGDGGDELFGGYTRYYDFNQTLKNRKDWTLLSDLYTKVLKKYLPKEEWKEEFLDALSLYANKAYALGRADKNEYIQKLGIGIGYDDFWYFRKFDHPELPPITRCQYIDFKTYLPADILTKVDRASMQNSIETRVPLLDTKIVEFAFALSQQDRCKEGELKGIVKKAYEGIIPHSILYKEKKGFSFPGSYWKSSEKDRWIIWKENFAVTGEKNK